MRIDFSHRTSGDGKEPRILKLRPTSLAFGDVRRNACARAAKLRSEFIPFTRGQLFRQPIARFGKSKPLLPHHQSMMGCRSRVWRHGTMLQRIVTETFIITMQAVPFPRTPLASGLWPLAFSRL